MDKRNAVEDTVIFSTCIIGDRAKAGDELSFFTVPKGQRMPQVPFDAQLCDKCRSPTTQVLADADTNLMQAGQLGSAIGDARLETLRAEINGGDPVVLEATVELKICGQKILSTTLEALVRGQVPIEEEYEGTKTPFALAARTDTVDARLRLTRDTKITGGPIKVKLLIGAKTLR